MNLTLVVGLTGAGKSTTLSAVRANAALLPNRRALTDSIIIPQVQREAGEEPRPVNDRLERFALTRRYRERHPGGVVHALQQYLRDHPPPDKPHLFDNVRGLHEVEAALAAFPGARFLLLAASPQVRLERLIGRADAFDSVNAASVPATRLENTVFIDHLLAIGGLEEVFDVYELARLEATTELSDEAILNAARIITAEQRNYRADETRAFLEATLDDSQLLIIDTDHTSVEDVVRKVRAWLS